jgi:D-arginine dehydrogenase
MSDFLIIGGGIAGLSAAARLSAHGKAVVIEAEEALGFHSSGRSATFSHYGIGNRAVRAMTHWSRTHFDPEAARTAPALFFATEEMLPGLDLLATEMAEFAPRLRSTAASIRTGSASIPTPCSRVSRARSEPRAARC